MTDVRSWKLIHDPLLKKGLQKLVRFDGVVPGNPVYNVHHLSDPRTVVPSRHPWSVREPLDLPIPCFKIDENYVGLPPPKEITFLDLNDNISPSFLADLCKKCGEYEELNIYYHPVDKRHLGIGRVVFKKIKDAKMCVEKYDRTSIMGKTVNVFVDHFGKHVKKLFEELSTTESSLTADKEKSSTSSTKRSQTVATTNTTTASSQSADSSVTTPHSVSTVVPEDPMVSQQTSGGYPPQVYPNCLPPSSMPFPWPGPQNYWPQQGMPWPPTWPGVPVPIPPGTYPPVYPQQQTQPPEMYSSWPSSTEEQSNEKPRSQLSGVENERKNRPNKDFGSSHGKRTPRSSSRQKYRDDRTPEHSSDRPNRDRKRFDTVREPVDKRSSNRFSRRKSPESLQKSEDRKFNSTNETLRRSGGSRREERRSPSSRRRRDDSEERHHRRSSRTPPRKMGNKLYNWHNRMRSSPIVAKYEKFRYNGRSKSSRDKTRSPDDNCHRGDNKNRSKDSKSKKGSDEEELINRRRKEPEPIVETYEEEYYRRKKLAHPVGVEIRGGDSKRGADVGGRKNEPGTSRSTTNVVDEIEEYKIVTRKLRQRTAPSNISAAKCDKLEVISSTEDDDDDDGDRVRRKASKLRKKIKTKKRSSSISSNNSSVRLQYSSLSEGESSTNEKERTRSTELNSSSNVEAHLECVSSSEIEDCSDLSPDTSADRTRRRTTAESRRKNRRDDDEPKHIVREVFKSKRVGLKNVITSKRHPFGCLDEKQRKDFAASSTNETKSRLENVKNNEFTDIRRSSSLDKRIQIILHGQSTKSSVDGAGTPLQDERFVDESLKASFSAVRISDKVVEAKVYEDDDKMSLSSGSRPTSRNEDRNNESQKCAVSVVVPPVQNLAMTNYNAYPPPVYHPSYDPNVYAAYAAYANMANSFGVPGAPQFAHPTAPPPWPTNFQPYPQQTSFESTKPVNNYSVNYKDPQVIKQFSNKSCFAVVKDLKVVLQKDILKRLIESSAFQTLDSWFATQEKLNEILKPKNDATVDKQTTTPVVQSVTTTPVASTLSRLFVNENNNNNSVSNASSSGNDLTRLFGFGLRASLPKLPSFKRKVLKSPPPSVRSTSDDEKTRMRRKRSSLSSSSSESLCSDKLSDDSDDEEKLSRSSDSSSDESVDKETIKDSFVALDAISDEEEEDDDNLENRVEDEEEEKLSSDDESDKMSAENVKSKHDGSSDERSSDDSCVEVTSEEESEENESEDENGTMEESEKSDVYPKKSATAQQDLSEELYKRSLEPPSSLGVYSDIVNDKENLPSVDERMVVGVNEVYLPTVYDHCYFLPKPAVEFFLSSAPNSVNQSETTMSPKQTPPKKSARGRPAKQRQSKVDDILTSKSATDFHDSVDDPILKLSLSENNLPKKVTAPSLPPPPPEIIFKPRDAVAEMKVLFDFLTNGIDEEDINLLKLAYDTLIADTVDRSWPKNTHWTPHIPTVSPPLKKRRVSTDEVYVHQTGSARTEGFYRPSGKLKRTFTSAARRANDDAVLPQSLQLTDQAAKQQAQLSREARSNQRRLLTTLGDADFLKFNQLKYRKKLIRFARSKIHGWGLFALEPIGPDEMIIEYVGEKVRLNVAEKREVNYEKVGIGSSYLFRIDNDMAIDATKRGAVARFINHSCNPSCYAKIISLDGEKRIVIYSKQSIAKGEEITYDYKFPFEDVKIPCNCGAYNCRGSLN